MSGSEVGEVERIHIRLRGEGSDVADDDALIETMLCRYVARLRNANALTGWVVMALRNQYLQDTGRGGRDASEHVGMPQPKSRPAASPLKSRMTRPQKETAAAEGAKTSGRGDEVVPVQPPAASTLVSGVVRPMDW